MMAEDGKLIAELAETLWKANQALQHKLFNKGDTTTLDPTAVILITLMGDDPLAPVNELNEVYAGYVVGAAQALGVSPDVYVRLGHAPVVPFSLNQQTAQIKNRLLIQSDAFRACSDCQGLFVLQNTSDAGRHTCSTCLRRHERDKKRLQRGTDLSERVCQVCDTKFTPKRSHAVCCSPKCRAKLSRQKKKG